MPFLNLATVITSITINSSSDRVLHLKPPIVSYLIIDLLAWTPSSTSPKTRWLFLEFCDSLRVRVILCHPNNPQGFPSTYLVPMHALLSPQEAMFDLAASPKVTFSFSCTLFLSPSFPFSSVSFVVVILSILQWDIAIFVSGCR